MPRKFYPVLHAIHDGDNLLHATEVALAAGADGIFLIDQGVSARDLAEVWIDRIRRAFGPNTWIGINFLRNGSHLVPTLEACYGQRIDGIWSDDCGVDSGSYREYCTAHSNVNNARIMYEWKGQYFGGTAFKTQAEMPLDQVQRAAKDARGLCDVITTSGRGTGVAASLEHVQAVHRGASGMPVGIASGVSPNNVKSYLPYVDAFLVATGIESSLGILDPAKTKAVADAVHSA